MKRKKRILWDRDRTEHLAHDDFYKNFLKGYKWLYEGSAPLMERIEKWAKKWPKDTAITGCDDQHHASSIIVLILHRKGRRVWGTTVYVVPQLDGQMPIGFFLYPQHVHYLKCVLEAIQRFHPWDKLAVMTRDLTEGSIPRYFGKSC